MNYGLIEGQRNTDWLAGTIPYEIRNPSGDWTSYLPPGEWQRNHIFDSMACVTFSALNSIEVQHRLITGQFRNFSDRFTATMSGTTSLGNYLWKVADSIRKDGLVDELIWPTADNFDWNTYYTAPTIEVINKAKEFLVDWEINYEFIDFNKESLIYHLKQSPIQVTIPGHAILNFLTTDQVINYFDSYSPWIKQTQQVNSALKIVLTEKNMTINKQQLEKLYQLGFKRSLDSGGEATWVGKELDVVLDGLILSKENQEYTPVFQAVKKLENDVRNGIF